MSAILKIWFRRIFAKLRQAIKTGNARRVQSATDANGDYPPQDEL
jgi:hypothetical protein